MGARSQAEPNRAVGSGIERDFEHGVGREAGRQARGEKRSEAAGLARLDVVPGINHTMSSIMVLLNHHT